MTTLHAIKAKGYPLEIQMISLNEYEFAVHYIVTTLVWAKITETFLCWLIATLSTPRRHEYSCIYLISNFFQWLMAGVSVVKLPSNVCHWLKLMITQDWFRRSIGALRQQAIIWTDVDPVLCCYIVSPGHDELKLKLINNF